MSCITRLPICDSGLKLADIVLGEEPFGDKNGLNVFYQTTHPFIFGTLKVKIDGRELIDDDIVVGTDNQSFELVINPNDRKRFNKPLCDEELRVDYIRAASGARCIINL